MPAKSPNSGAPNEWGRGDRALGAIVEYVGEYAPDELAAWALETRLRMAQFEPWRSRRVEWVKPFKNSKQEDCYRTKDGKVYPAEVFRHEYERLDDSPKEDA